MSVKQVAFYIGCAGAWGIVLPVLVVGGGVALLMYAVLMELLDTLGGGSKKSPDLCAAREAARRMCLGH